VAWSEPGDALLRQSTFTLPRHAAILKRIARTREYRVHRKNLDREALRAAFLRDGRIPGGDWDS
jgi:hypothetical protein